ncbi:CAAX prenyl protease 2 [Citrus sinensis]|uniref:CAAX prenyl protease 2 n=1 Tax=Citrus sinensis TaxID=2711 RepID=A0ACB8JZT5_CITSI|nr:CAAX prenyl protease 2 [Citrus sinensis]
MEQETEAYVSKAAALMACVLMTLSYVGILYAPTLILRLPPPASLKHYLIRRFICAAISSIISLIFSALILPWQAAVFPLFLTSLMYAGSMVLKSLLLLNSWTTDMNNSGGLSLGCIKIVLWSLRAQMFAVASNILAWRNFVVAPLTEELVFRACMIPLLLCGGFKINTIIFLCPVFFSLGLQLGYTVVFGWYASFLFIRTGHLAAPLIAHIFCNYMGLPVVFARNRGLVSVAFVAGMVAFLWLLFPITRPDLYNDRTNNCRCLHGYCSWN